MKKILVLVGTMLIFMFCGCHSVSEPDCIGSMVIDGNYDLQIVANCSHIKDKASFATLLYEKCKENTFRSTIFSYDITGYPRKLTMDVYLRKNDVKKDEPIMRIEFHPDEREKECNIKDNPEEYVLYINGQKIE